MGGGSGPLPVLGQGRHEGSGELAIRFVARDDARIIQRDSGVVDDSGSVPHAAIVLKWQYAVCSYVMTPRS